MPRRRPAYGLVSDRAQPKHLEPSAANGYTSSAMRPLDFLIFALSVGGFVVAWSWFVRRQRIRLLGEAVDARALTEIATHDAIDLGHASVEPVHLLRAITLDPRGQRTLRAGRIDAVGLRTACDALMRELPIPRLPSERDYRSSEAKKISHGWLIRFLRRAAGRRRATIPGLLVQLTFERQIEHVLEQHGVTRDVFRDLAVGDDPLAPAVEVVNDNVTKFDFVVDALSDVAGMDDSSARAFARAVHVRGREWLAVASADEARGIATALVERARAAGIPLEARAILDTVA
jgi:ATP-dependent Clp protease adapter protein ClpS